MLFRSLLREIDAGTGYREAVERDLAKRMGPVTAKAGAAGHACPACATANDEDARFCKSCGARL